MVFTTPAKTVPIVIDVATNARLTAKFSRDILPSSLDANSFSVACPLGSPVLGTVTYDAANRIAVLQHAALFDANTTCQATITTAAKDTAGIGLAKDYVWSFTTGATTDTTPPTVTTTKPADAATGVCLSKPVSMVFSEAMDATSITAASFYVNNPANAATPGAITYDSLSSTATFAVTDPTGFVANTVYTAHVTTLATDLAGNALAADKVVSSPQARSCVPL